MAVFGRNRQKVLRTDPELFEKDGVLGANSVEDVLLKSDKINLVKRHHDLLDYKKRE